MRMVIFEISATHIRVTYRNGMIAEGKWRPAQAPKPLALIAGGQTSRHQDFNGDNYIPENNCGLR
jgi:hypothetical protein